PVFRPPTATEVFELRSKCAALAEKLRGQYPVGIALTQDGVSHYDPKTNRCYVELSAQPADLSKTGETYSRSVFDGQTGEMLAHVHKEKDGRLSAYVKDNVANVTDYYAALAKIESLMADDRTR